MRTCYDSIVPASLPEGGDLYAGYCDGDWSDYTTIRARFPTKTVIAVTTNPADNEGDMLDVENGDASPTDAPTWLRRRRLAGHDGPLIYCAEANRAAVKGAIAAARVAQPGLFIAAYPGNGAVLQQPTDVGHQYRDAGPYDISVVVDYLPGIDPPPTPAPPPATQEEPMFVASVAGETEVFVVWSNGTKTGIEDPATLAVLLAITHQSAPEPFPNTGFIASLPVNVA